MAMSHGDVARHFQADLFDGQHVDRSGQAGWRGE